MEIEGTFSLTENHTITLTAESMDEYLLAIYTLKHMDQTFEEMDNEEEKELNKKKKKIKSQ